MENTFRNIFPESKVVLVSDGENFRYHGGVLGKHFGFRESFNL